ncbi:hypothetical protein RRG08_006158 [Elysia crispata]|uniref:Uncharacterized protein n=1 Tax=Elysia crispata TaxID=231223 RepID=A0AAE1AY69_9GAST|nr:hypothetical protein RRG08_006158 [Elysia crispata]
MARALSKVRKSHARRQSPRPSGVYRLQQARRNVKRKSRVDLVKGAKTLPAITHVLFPAVLFSLFHASADLTGKAQHVVRACLSAELGQSSVTCLETLPYMSLHNRPERGKALD